jgi:hypothetical protein
MAISVNTSDSLYSQVIQSTQNRYRISEQSGQNQNAPADQEGAAYSAKDGTTVSSASGADYERAYEAAKNSLRMPNATSPQAAAYANVQQLGQRDELQDMLAFSTYA